MWGYVEACVADLNPKTIQKKIFRTSPCFPPLDRVPLHRVALQDSLTMFGEISRPFTAAIGRVLALTPLLGNDWQHDLLWNTQRWNCLEAAHDRRHTSIPRTTTRNALRTIHTSVRSHEIDLRAFMKPIPARSCLSLFASNTSSDSMMLWNTGLSIAE